MLPVSRTDRIFILTGAGVSAESGIPTFRGVGGLWRNYRIEEVASPEAWYRDPRFVWEFYSMRRRVASEAKPNPAHFALAKLEDTLQDRLFVCTQNVDSLHEQAGSRKVVHMHGELFKSRCDGCTRLPFDDNESLRSTSRSPQCECGGRIRPHICWSFVAHVAGRARTIYVGPEEPANASSFTECYLGKAGEELPHLFSVL